MLDVCKTHTCYDVVLSTSLASTPLRHNLNNIKRDRYILKENHEILGDVLGVLLLVIPHEIRLNKAGIHNNIIYVYINAAR